MKKVLLPAMLMVSTLFCAAQIGNFGIVNYVVPDDYQLIKKDNVLTYYKEDKSTGAYCNFFIYNTMPGHGGTQQDFDFGWINLMQNPFKFTSSANMPSTKNEAQYLIWFNKDGSFDDRGTSVVDLKNPHKFPDDAPGKGKYTIENYSIFLQYDNGRIKQLGFSGFLDKDPATVTDAYFIGRHIYYRKDKGYNSNLGYRSPLQ